MTAVLISASDLPVVLAALAAGGGVPPAPPLAAARRALEEGRPAPDRAGTGRTHSFDETDPYEEKEAHGA